MAKESLILLLSSSIGLALVLLITSPTIWRLVRIFGSSAKRNGPIALQDLYQDEDGTATEDSQAAFSDWLPRTVFYLASTIGFTASMGSAVCIAVWDESVVNVWLLCNWANTVAWVTRFMSCTAPLPQCYWGDGLLALPRPCSWSKHYTCPSSAPLLLDSLLDCMAEFPRYSY